jgi:gluconate 2-dehydrogenase alpha chain
MAQHQQTDVVIIGMGAAGGIAAYALTKAGLNVVGIEAGPRLSHKDFIKRLDELGEAFQFRNSLGAPKFNREIPTWRLNAKAPTTQQPPGIFAMANAVGGSSVHYGAQSWRLHEDDFTIRSSTIKRYGKGALPHGTSIIDWPVSYAELEPYYDQVEYLIGVSGKAGNITGKVQAGGNPFEAPRDRDYPMPPLRSLEFATKLGHSMHELGYHPFPQPAAITSRNFNGRPPCSYCGFCGYGFGCWNDSKSSTLVSAIKEAEKTGKLEIRTNSRVMKIMSDGHGRVTGVQYRDSHGKTHEQPARFVILAGYIYENNRLLLLSKSASYPHGLSNNHHQVGKYFMSQIGAGPAVNGLYPNARLNLWGGTSGQTVVMDDLDGDNFNHHGLGFIRGGSIQVSTNGMPIAQSTNVPPDVPLWGNAYKRFLHDNIDAVGGLAAQTDVLPYDANFVDLDPVKKDDLGVPVLRVTYNLYENEHKMAAYLTERMTHILKASGAKKTWGGAIAPIPVSSHAYGGTRMGEDPGNSVVDQYSISHEAPNLAVMGASTFVSTSGFNPTETVEALAWYGADHIAKNFGTLAA